MNSLHMPIIESFSLEVLKIINEDLHFFATHPVKIQITYEFKKSYINRTVYLCDVTVRKERNILQVWFKKTQSDFTGPTPKINSPYMLFCVIYTLRKTTLYVEVISVKLSVT
jgi:hypothetical protein